MESDYGEYEEFVPTYLEPVLMTEMWVGDEMKSFYHYPKTTAISLKAFNKSIKFILARRDAVFGAKASMSDYHPDDLDNNFVEGEREDAG